jgi:cobalt/nickel transport system permease protein
MLFHLGAVHLTPHRPDRPSLWQTLNPSARVLCIFLLVFANALTPNGHWNSWAFYSVAVLGLILVSRVQFSVLLQRVSLEALFAGVIILGTLTNTQGSVVWRWGWFQLTDVGLTIFGSVLLKAMLSLVLLNILVLTTTVPDLLKAFAALKVPPLLVAIMASMYRYIGVLMEEFKAMQRAAASRNLNSTRRWQRLVTGNMMGALFIRTYERGERVNQAMLSRGYIGLPKVNPGWTASRYDIGALTLTAIWTVMGQIFYWPS